MRACLAACFFGCAVAGHSGFVIEDEHFGSGDELVALKVLKNQATGERLEVAHERGGRTEALELISPVTGELKSVLLNSERNVSDVLGNVGWKGDMLIPYANRIKNATYNLNGKTYYMERNEDRSPYGLEGLHGYLYKKKLAVVEQVAGRDEARLVLGYDFDGSDPGYPFPLRVNLTYRLTREGIVLTTKAANLGKEQPLPFYNSWHSYFKVSDVSKAVITLDRCSEWNHLRVSNDSNIDSDLIPTGLTEPFHAFDGRRPVGGTTEQPTYYDDEFKAIAPEQRCPKIETRVSDPSTGETSVLFSDSQFRWIQVYTGAMKSWGKQAIAVEAMSSECDAWNNMQGVRILQAGETWEGTFGVRLEGHRSAVAV